MATTYPAEAERANNVPRILAWTGLILGGLMSGTSLFDSDAPFGGLLMGLGLLLPAGWWFYCESKDRKLREHYTRTAATNAHLARYLGPGDSAVLHGMSGAEPPAPVNRKWPLVALGSVALLGMGGALVPPTEAEPVAPTSAATTSSSATTTTATTDPAEEAQRSEQARASAEASRSSEARQREEEEARRAEEERQRAEEERQRAEQARAEEEERARAEQARLEEEARARAEREAAERAAAEEANTQPQGLLAPAPAPAPERSAYYPNCTAVWNETGGPIYRGQPGYDSHLDRDGDGVGCEKRPR